MIRNDEAMLAFVKKYGERLIELEERLKAEREMVQAQLASGKPITWGLNPARTPNMIIRAGSVVICPDEYEPITDREAEVFRAYARGDDVLVTILAQERD